VVRGDTCSTSLHRLPGYHHGLPVDVEIDRTARLKVIDACGLTCTFCHNEGTPVSSDNANRQAGTFLSNGRSGRTSIYIGSNGVDFVSDRMRPDQEYRAALAELWRLGYREVHLTGGEPTLHTELPELVGIATDAGFTVGMTSNGENGAATMAACAAAGLDRVNISVFGTTAEELAQVQAARYRSLSLGRRKITAMRRTIEAALDNGIGVSANMVVPDASHIDRVRRVTAEYSPVLSLRLLNSLDDGAKSVDAVLEALRSLDAEPVRYKLALGASGYRVDYRLPSGRLMSFKRLRPTRLATACRSCPIDRAGKCEEGFYGVRVYRATDGRFLAGVCIQRMDLTLPLTELGASRHLADIRALVDREERDVDELVEALPGPFETGDVDG
jgi:GTP 3',8-cyclase